MKIVDWSYTTDFKTHSLDHYNSWIKNSLHGPLGYMADERKTEQDKVHRDLLSKLVGELHLDQLQETTLRKLTKK